MLLTSLFDTFPTGPIVLDASTIFNLLGCGKPIEVVHALRVPCLIEERTLKEIKRHPVPGLCHEKILSSLVDSGHLGIHRMSSEEYELYLSLVSGMPSECLDDGESAAIAVAVSQQYAVILDDGKARRIHGRRFATTPYASSLRLFLAAVNRAGWPTEQMHEVIRAARINARMNIAKGEEALFAGLGIS